MRRILAFLMLVAIGASAAAEAAESRPNVLLIVGDDIGFGDLGFAGAATRTPNLDQLAAEGALFTRFHASPVCSISRAMLMTGADPVEVGLAAFDYALYPPAKGTSGYEAYLTHNAVTIAEILQRAGWFTAMAGKWHLGGTRHGGKGPHAWGFDRSYAIYTGGANHWNAGVFHVDVHDPAVMEEVKSGVIPEEPYYENGIEVERPMGIFSDSLWTQKIIEYLEEARRAERPFFAYLAYTTPHAPLQAPDWLIDKYIERYLELGYEGLKGFRWESQKRNGVLPPDAPLPDRATNPLLRPWDDLSDEEKRIQARMLATYSAMMESQDMHIGMLLNYLAETDRRDDTLIIYLSDNGPEGLDIDGELSNPIANRWVERNFSQDPADIGRGNAFGFIGTDWADSVTGGLSWWKWFIGEGGVRVPMIVIPPRGAEFAQSGVRTAEFATVKDLPMTILDYAGVSHPGTEFEGRAVVEPSGVSLRPFLEGTAEEPRTEEQWHAFELFGNGYVVQGDWKAIRVRPGMYGDGVWHLYNIRNDPGETATLEAEHPERLAQMISLYKSWAAAGGIVPVRDDWSPWHGFPEDRK